MVRKSSTPKRHDVQITKDNVKRLKKSLAKDEKVGHWVNDAIMQKYHNEEGKKELELYRRMGESGTFHQNQQLRSDKEQLMSENDRLKEMSDVFIQEEVKQKIWQKKWDKKMDAFFKRRGI